MTYYYQKFSTPFGPFHLVATDDALVALAFNDNWDAVRKKLPELTEKNSPILKLAVSELKNYFAGKLKKFTVPIDPKGTDFQCQAWKALVKIPFGKTVTYQEQAEKLKIPKAVRAVARSNALNPISIIIPCHRVIGKSGHLTGYAGGIETKAALLKAEGFKPKTSLRNV